MDSTRPTLAFLPVQPYAHLLDVLVERGHDRAQILATCGLDETIFARTGYLSIAQMETLVGHACALVPELGREIGARVSLMSHGWLSVAALSAPTIGDAIEIVARHFALVSPLFVVTVRAAEGELRVRLSPRWELATEVERYHATAFGAAMMEQLPRLSQGSRAFEIDAASRELRIHAAIAEQRLPLADARVHHDALARCKARLDAQPDPTRTAATVRRVLLACGAPFPDLDGTAKRLATSSRSLRRRLREEGTSFRTLLDEVRSTIADEWLDDPRRSITEIGLDLGYTDAANFARAYRRANGRSPSEARRERMGLSACA